VNLRPILAAYFIALCLSCAIGILTFRSWFDPRPADSAMACCALPIILPLLASGGPLTFVLGPIAFLAAPVWLIACARSARCKRWDCASTSPSVSSGDALVFS